MFSREMKKYLYFTVISLLVSSIQSQEFLEFLERLENINNANAPTTETLNVTDNSNGQEQGLLSPDPSEEPTKATENVNVATNAAEDVTETRHENTEEVAAPIQGTDDVTGSLTTDSGDVTKTRTDDTMDVLTLFDDEGVTGSNVDDSSALPESTKEIKASGKPGIILESITSTESVSEPEPEVPSPVTKYLADTEVYQIVWVAVIATCFVVMAVILILCMVWAKTTRKWRQKEQEIGKSGKRDSDIVISFQSFPTNGDIWKELKTF